MSRIALTGVILALQLGNHPQSIRTGFIDRSDWMRLWDLCDIFQYERSSGVAPDLPLLRKGNDQVANPGKKMVQRIGDAMLGKWEDESVEG